MNSCLLMGQSLYCFRSPDYMARCSLTGTKTILLTVRYMIDPLRHCTNLCFPDYQFAPKPSNHQPLIGSPAVCMMHGLSEAPGCSRSMKGYLGLVNGCGQTLHIHWRHEALHHLRSLPTDSSPMDQRTYNYWVLDESHCL